jgi:hypothetical protein
MKKGQVIKICLTQPTTSDEIRRVQGGMAVDPANNFKWKMS